MTLRHHRRNACAFDEALGKAGDVVEIATQRRAGEGFARP